MNETLGNVTEQIASGLNGLTFDSVNNITSNPYMIGAFALVWFLPLLIYIIWGSLASARTSDGRKLQSKVIQNPNFWIGVIIFGLIQFALFILIIFPVWLMPFE